MRAPRVIYDPWADVLRLELLGTAQHSSVRVAPGTRVVLDRKDRVVVVEVLGAKKRYPAVLLAQCAPPDLWLTLKEAAVASGLAVVTLKVNISAGRLKAEKGGRVWFVRHRELLDYLKSRPGPGRQATRRKGRREKAVEQEEP